MKKVVLFLIMSLLFAAVPVMEADASLVSDKIYRTEQRKENKKMIKQIKSLFNEHNRYANQHDLNGLETLYADSYINNDGFNKEVYFKSIKETWDSCNDLTYTTKITSIDINGDYASVNVEEYADGTLRESSGFMDVTGEIHSKSTGIYHLVLVNDRWLISGETSLTDESSLLYGDARFMNIEIQAPAQVNSGDVYTTTVKIDADSDTFIVGSIDRDSVTYPVTTPHSELRAMPQSQTLERLLKANTDNLNEYTVASLAISKAKDVGGNNFRVYMAGLACVMKRVNVIPKNEYIKIEDK